MVDLPDYYTQAQISEAEAASFKGGLDANKSAAPTSRQVYFATDTGILYVCVVDGTWTGFDASILTQGILTLYANMVAGGYRITGLGAPTAANDAVRKAYADLFTLLTTFNDHHARHESGGDDEPSVAGLSGELADDQPPKSHGADKHTDVTRTLFISPGNKYDGTLASSFAHEVINLVTAADKFVYFEFGVPPDFVTFISLKVVWWGSGGVAGEDWVCDPSASYQTEGEARNTHSDDPANTTIDVTAVTIEYRTDVGFTLANLALGDTVGIRITRKGTDGSDNYAGNVQVAGLLLTYTASQ